MPPARSRYRETEWAYADADVPFGAYRTLASPASQWVALTGPGVYKLSLASESVDYLLGQNPIFYIGSAQNLRKRLLDHLVPNGKNGVVSETIAGAACRYPLAPLREGYRKVSRAERNWLFRMW